MALWRDVLTNQSIAADPGLDFDIALSSATEAVRLSLRDGRLRLNATAVAREPDLAIRLSDISLEDLLLGKALTSDAFADAEIEARGHRRPALPATECRLAPGADFAPLPGASLSVGFGVTSTIFGDVGLAERWLDGALVGSELIALAQLEASHFDVRVWCSLGELAALRRRELTPLDAIAGGLGISADWPELMCFFELVQHPAYAAAWPPGRDVEAEIAWGSIFCSRGYGEAVDAVRSRDEAVLRP